MAHAPVKPYHGKVRAGLIVNPICRASNRAVKAIRKASQSHGWEEPLILSTTIDQPGGDQAKDALSAGVERLVVAGGDGTIRQVAAVVAQAGSTTPALGVLPIGAANLVARNLGLRPGHLDEAAEMALMGVPHPLSVGWVACRVAGLWQDEQPMLAVAGIGRDAQAIATTRPWLKRRTGWLAYVESGGRQASQLALPMIISRDDGQDEPTQAWSVLFAILPRLPLGIIAFPGVGLGSEVAQVLEVAVSRPSQWGAVVAKGLLHTRRSVEVLRYSSARRLTTKPSQPCPVQIDGDLVANVEEARFRLTPAAIMALGPSRRNGHDHD